MQITELSTKESKQLLLVHSKIHYDKLDSVKQLASHIEKKGYFKTPAGLAYKNALNDYIEGKVPIDCIYCGGELSEDSYLICNDCHKKLIDRAVNETEEIKDNKHKTKGQHEAEANKPKFRLKKSVIAAFLIIALILLVIAVLVGLQKKSEKDLDSAIANGDQVLAVDSILEMQNRTEGSSEKAQAGDNSTLSGSFDGFDFLGASFGDLQAVLGSSEQVLDENTRYFSSCGVSVIYDPDSGAVTYIDNDGTGNGQLSVPIFGILPGVSYEDARRIFTGNGIDTVDYSADSFMCMFQVNGNTDFTYEIDVTGDEKGNVVLVAARIVYYN